MYLVDWGQIPFTDGGLYGNAVITRAWVGYLPQRQFYTIAYIVSILLISLEFINL